MFRVFISIIAMLFLVGKAFASPDTRCRNAFQVANIPLSTSINVKPLNPSLNYSNKYTKKQIKSISGSHLHNHSVSINGLTVGNFTSSISGQFLIVNISNNYSCVFPKTVNAKMGYEKIDVYVASEFQPGSCEYNETLKHENEHVEVNYNKFSKYYNITQRELQNFIKSSFPVMSPKQNPQDYAISKINDVFYKIMKRMEVERDGANAQLDSPLNYHKIRQKCSNW